MQTIRRTNSYVRKLVLRYVLLFDDGRYSNFFLDPAQTNFVSAIRLLPSMRSLVAPITNWLEVKIAKRGALTDSSEKFGIAQTHFTESLCVTYSLAC